jgi:integrase/recombinase XerC
MTDLIGRHVAHITQAGLSVNTIDSRRDLLRRMDAELPMGLELATVEELTHWLARDGWSRQTRATYFGHVKSFYDWACDPRNPHLDWNPAASLTRPRVPKGLPKPCTDGELAYVLANPGMLLIPITLAAYAGLRCCELATIERRDVNEHTLTIVGKGGKTRAIPTNPFVWDTVRGRPPGRLVRGTAGQISKSGRDHFDRIGQPAVTMHRLRHWFATSLLENGADLLTVSLLLGHASTTTTVRYCQISDRQRRNAIQALPVLSARASTC